MEQLALVPSSAVTCCDKDSLYTEVSVASRKLTKMARVG